MYIACVCAKEDGDPFSKMGTETMGSALQAVSVISRDSKFALKEMAKGSDNLQVVLARESKLPQPQL